MHTTSAWSKICLNVRAKIYCLQKSRFLSNHLEGRKGLARSVALILASDVATGASLTTIKYVRNTIDHRLFHQNGFLAVVLTLGSQHTRMNSAGFLGAPLNRTGSVMSTFDCPMQPLNRKGERFFEIFWNLKLPSAQIRPIHILMFRKMEDSFQLDFD